MKRVLPFLCILLLLSGNALAQGQTFAIPYGEGTAVCDAQGNITCPADTYCVIYDLDPERGIFCAQVEETYLTCIVDSEGNPLCDAVYEDIYLEDGVLYVRQNDLLGVLNDDYTEKIPCKYTELVYTGEGTFLAITTDPFDGKADGVYLVDENAAQTVTGARVYYGLNPFSEGLMPAMSADTSCYGYLNTKGEWAIAAQYDYAGEFHKGCAEASLESGLGLIDKEGNWLLTPRYISLYSNLGESTLVMAQEDTESAVLIDTATMEKIKTFTAEDVWFAAGYDTDVVSVYLPEETILVNAAGETVLSAATDAYFLSDAEMGDLVIAHGSNWGEYETVLYTLSGEARTKAYQDMGYLTTYNGTRLFLVTEFDTEEVTEEDEVWLEEVPDTTRYGVIDEFGNEVLPMDGYFVEEACDGVLLLTSDTGCALYDLETGNRIALQ